MFYFLSEFGSGSPGCHGNELLSVVVIVLLCLLYLSEQCMHAEVKDKANRYFVHYNGWNKKSVFISVHMSL